MKINIRDKSTGKPITAVDVHPFGLVSVLKTVISSKINYPPDSQTIFYRGRQLDDARRIDFYNLHGNATVDLVVMKINGGPDKQSTSLAEVQLGTENADLKNKLEKLLVKMSKMEADSAAQHDSIVHDTMMREKKHKDEAFALNQKLEEEYKMHVRERRNYKQKERQLESQAITLSSMVDVEIERSVQLHQEKTLLQKKLTEMATRLHVDDLIDVMIETAYIQLQWKEMGTELGIPQSVLEDIARKHSTSSITRCHYEVMRYWIVDIGASWEALASALQSSEIKQETFADKIRQKYVNSRRGKRVQNNVLILKDDESISSGADLIQYDIFTKVDWKVLGLLLGVSDDNLESIEKRCSSEVDQCQQSMIDQWIETGQAYWSVLIDTLDGPVLSMMDIADRIAKDKLNQHTQQARDSSNQHVTACPYEINKNEVNIQQEKIKYTLTSHKGTLKGIVFVFGMVDVPGVYKDLETVRETFRNILKFAVHRVENPDGQFLANFIKAAATFPYVNYPGYQKSKLKVAFYFAGHGGIDEHKRPFYLPQQLNKSKEDEKDVILIRETILSHFHRVGSEESFLFFFDCCLSALKDNKENQPSDMKNDESLAGDESFHLEAPLRCVIAYATSVGLVSTGNTKVGGRWTSCLCKNIKEQVELGEVLALTHKDVMEISENTQPPQYHSCVGPIYLRGKPERVIKETDVESKNVFKQYRKNLFEVLSNNQTEVITFATRINVNSPSVIDDSKPSALGRMNKDDAASTLLDCLEKAFDENANMLHDTLKDMERISILVGIAQRMRESSMETSKATVTTDMAKALKEYKEKEVKLGNENTNLKSKLNDLQDDYSKMEDNTRDMTKSFEEAKKKETELDNKLQELQEESSKMEARSLDVTKSFEEAKKKETELENKLQGLQEESSKMEAQSLDVTKSFEEVKKKEMEVGNKNVVLTDKLKELEEQSIGEKTKLEKRIAELEDQIKAINTIDDEVKLTNDNSLVPSWCDSKYLRSTTTMCIRVVDSFSAWSKTNGIWWSEPFYSSEKGYKLEISIGPNGYGPYRGEYMYVGIQLMKGEYDANLSWPFKGNVTVQILNWSSDNHHFEQTIQHYQAPLQDRERVVAPDKIRAPNSYGIHKYISLKDLHLKSPALFLSADRLCFRILRVDLIN